MKKGKFRYYEKLTDTNNNCRSPPPYFAKNKNFRHHDVLRDTSNNYRLTPP